MNTALLDEEGAVPHNIVRTALSRGVLFFWSGLVLIANALAGLALNDLAERDFASSLMNLFGISAIILAACAASLALLKADDGSASRRDYIVATICVVAAIIPNASIARLCLSFFGVYLVATSTSGDTTRRGGIIMLALGGALFWGQFLVTMLGHPMLELDAMITSSIYGLERVGNTLNFVGGAPGGIIVAGGCSSWHGLSVAILFWVLLYQWFEIPVRKASFGYLALAMLLTVAINSLRLAALVSFPAHFEEIHVGYGLLIANWATMLGVIVICLFGERRALFAR